MDDHLKFFFSIGSLCNSAPLEKMHLHEVGKKLPALHDANVGMMCFRDTKNDVAGKKQKLFGKPRRMHILEMHSNGKKAHVEKRCTMFFDVSFFPFECIFKWCMRRGLPKQLAFHARTMKRCLIDMNASTDTSVGHRVHKDTETLQQQGGKTLPSNSNCRWRVSSCRRRELVWSAKSGWSKLW